MTYVIRFNSSKNKVNLFYVAYFIVIIRELVINRSNIGSLISSNLLNYISDICLIFFIGIAFYIFIGTIRFTIKEFYITLFLVIIFAMSAYIAKSYLLFECILLILCCKHVNFEEFIKFSFLSLSIIFLCIVILALFGIIDMGIQYRNDTNSIRYGLGFIHSNTLAIFSFQWICQYLYLNRQNYKNKKYIVCVFIFSTIYFITNSYSQLISSLLLIAVCFIYENTFIKGIKLSKRILRKLLTIVVIISLIIIIYAIYYFWQHPNEMIFYTFRSRIFLSQQYISAYGIHWLGNEITLGTNVRIPGYRTGYFYLDNAYARILVQYGILPSICILVAYICYYKKLIKSNDWLILAISFCYLIYAISEFSALIVIFNVFLIHIGVIFYQQKKV